MHSLVIDRGNTKTKLGVFFEEDLVVHKLLESKKDLLDLVSEYSIKYACISNVGRDIEDLKSSLNRSGVNVLVAGINTRLPLEFDYETPKTLGFDRLVSCVGAQVFFPNHHSLIADMGTCITLDFFESGDTFRGGWIMPGIQMRFNSMHEGTANLPLLKPEPFKEKSLLGTSTEKSMRNGVIKAIEMELLGLRSSLIKDRENINLIITGGDHVFFDSLPKDQIFVRPNLNLYGLNRILSFNAEVF